MEILNALLAQIAKNNVINIDIKLTPNNVPRLIENRHSRKTKKSKSEFKCHKRDCCIEFETIEELNNHTRGEHGCDSQCTYPKCGKFFSKRSGLVQHILRFHKQSLP